MVAAELDEVVEVGGSTAGPVPDVVGVHDASFGATGERQPPSRAWSGGAATGWTALGAADAGHGAVDLADESDDLGVARDASCRLGRDAGTAVELAGLALVVGEYRGVDVDDDEVAIRG